MLQIKEIYKEYRTGGLVQKALDGVSLNLRDNEFVAILGPSGSGKTTLLNIIGGLDRYDSGDLVINGISTKKYSDRDWDSYRNHTIGFVFQSYNLIPHQTVLANVELALTISGISRSERRRRAAEALEQVGLGNQLHKKPSQMSGGQMQRVAIARALVNNPDILLADEPTGALDTDTSVQVMELLKEVAKDRLVVMVTHNPELADKYATRIVNLRDGRIQSDTDCYEVPEDAREEARHENMGKSSMSFLTALSLSFHNLWTKKARTLLTAFAGSIGIIGIAAILSLSTGVNDYIKSVEEDTLAEYPLQITKTGLNLSSMMTNGMEDGGEERESRDIHVIQMVNSMFSTMDTNDLESLKQYLDNGDSGIEKYTSAIEYSYNISPQIYRQDGNSIRQVHPDRSFDAMGFGSASGANSLMSSLMSTDVFYPMPENASLYESQYEVKAGHWPENYRECVLVLSANGGMSDFLLYTLGLREALELDEMVRQFINEEEIDLPDMAGAYDYSDILGTSFKLVNSADYYAYDSEYNTWVDKSGDKAYMRQLVDNGEDITIVGIVQPKEGANGRALMSGINYPASLTAHVSEQAGASEIVQKQLAASHVDVFTNEPFGQERNQSAFDMSSLFTIDEDAFADAFQFDSSALTNGMADSMDLSGALGDPSQSMDLSGSIDLGNVNLEIPNLPPINMADILGNVQISVSQEGFRQLAAGLLEGYQEYAAQNPQADYTRLGEYFLQYLQTEEGRQILTRHIMQIIQDNGDIAVSTEKLTELIRRLMEGYMDYVTQNGYTDPDQFGDSLEEYLRTPEAAGIMEQWAQENLVISGDLEISSEQLNQLAAELMEGYGRYADENNLPDPSKMGEHVLDYLGTEDAAQRIAAGLGSIVDTDSLTQQISTALESYMGEVMSSYSSVLAQTLETQINAVVGQIMEQLGVSIQRQMQQAFSGFGSQMENAMQIDPEALMDAFEMKMSGDELTELMMSMNAAGTATYDSNLQKLGYADFDQPSGINIYPIDFESKEHVVQILDDYNSRMEADGKEEQVITYTDMVGTLMSSVTDIIDVISYVLIAFVAISLIVSSIMIGVITYISVLERKKEIGILRAIGASKGNISQVFNAETFIIGLCAGLIGIGFTLLLLIPSNMLIHHLADTTEINAVLPIGGAVILILLSVGLTLLGGLIPARKASKSDPVTALRTE